MNFQHDPQAQPEPDAQKKTYISPAIIYEGEISTRAGSPVSIDLQPDEIDLFADPDQ